MFYRQIRQPRCASCDVELFSDPLWLSGETFCCSGCAQGGPCVCTYEDYQRARRRSAVRGPAFMEELFRTYSEGAD